MLDIDATVIAVVAIIGLATFVRAAIGFGDALIAMGLVSGLIGLQTATPLIALVGTAISIGVLVLQWGKFQIRAILPLIIATLLGIPFGLGLLTLVPEQIAIIVLGIVLVSYGAYGLLGLQLPVITSDRPAGLFGFVAGILGGAYNTSGLVIAIYGTLKRWQPEEFQLTLQGYFFCTNFLILAGHGLSGLWTAEVLWLFGVSLPVIGLAIWLGNITNRRIKRELFAKVVFGFLVVIGLILLINNALQ
ncbi:sulfite exporter TauE/SafE family protein [Oscillatoria sp. FACHB-1407]|uniref:sulfite exporter TauE/SafE family protein n=1 Tax=Oscillatoria sp. FACHB-1407 TaxID=2692847 RepID=UPI0016887D0A|nr:sulfite exporter TauE/SafE family protein [Oscillatoria sp. FACHB-1407]MBD2460956.1 sulfite exporter TauE/SafE family protein [Oscillatoria sp. FACHB-1407]